MIVGALVSHLPECIIENLLSVRRDSVLERIDLDLRVQLQGSCGCYAGLGAAGRQERY
jgi:hypothetical protein